MASENGSTNLLSLFDYKDNWASNSLSLVKDPYSGKYYGNGDFSSVSNSISNASKYYTQLIKDAESNKWGTQDLMKAPTGVMGIPIKGALSPYEEAKVALSNISSNTFDSSNYVQKPQMVESYGAHTEGWNSYFESAYKTPRLQENNAEIAQQNLKDQGSTGGTATGNQLVASNLEIRKEVGTGVGKESVGLNPFGKLDAGLNI